MENTNTNAPRVETYLLVSSTTGRKIRKATRVVFADGRVVKFHDRMTKRMALLLANDPMFRS